MNPLERDGFVKVYRRVAAEIYGRLRRRKAADTMGTFVLLVFAADHRTRPGFVPGSRRAIAKALGIPLQTFFDHVGVLADAGEVEVARAVNQHTDGAGIMVVRYDEIISGSAAAVRDPVQHAVRDPVQHRPRSGTADPDLPAETRPEEVKKLGTPRTKPSEGDAGRRPPSPFEPDGRPEEKAMLAAVAAALGHDPAGITRSYRSSWTTAVRDLLGQSVVPAEIPFRVEAFKDLHGRVCRTPSDLSKYWGTLRSEKAQRARELRGSLVPTYGVDAIDGVVTSAIEAHPNASVEQLKRLFGEGVDVEEQEEHA